MTKQPDWASAENIVVASGMTNQIKRMADGVNETIKQPDWDTVVDHATIPPDATIHIKPTTDGVGEWAQETPNGVVPVDWAELADRFVVEGDIRIERVDSIDGTHW